MSNITKPKKRKAPVPKKPLPKKKGAPKRKAPFRKIKGESWSAGRNRGARELGYKDYTEYRLRQGLRSGKTIQQARGHGGPGDKREKLAKSFRPGKRSTSIFRPRLREATTTQTPAYFYDLAPYPRSQQLALVPSIIHAGRRIKKKTGAVAARFFRYGDRYGDSAGQLSYYYDDTNFLDTSADWLTFRADLTMGISGQRGDAIVGVWFYAAGQRYE